MSKSDSWENGLLKLIFNNASFSDLGDSGGIRGSATVGSLYVSLHKSNPGEAGNQSTGEVTSGDIPSYERVEVSRDASGWTVTGSTAENAASVTFPESDGAATITHFGIGTSKTGAGKMLYYGELSSPLSVTAGVTPSFAAGDLTITED